MNLIHRSLGVAASALLCLLASDAFAQSPTPSPQSTAASSPPSSTVAKASSEEDEANSSPRERGRILRKRNPIASEYQIFGELGTNPGSDADGEGVDYRANFSTANLIGNSSESLSLGYALNYNNLSGIAKSGGSLGFRKAFGNEQQWVIAGQARSSSSDRRIEHYQAVWQQRSPDEIPSEGPVFYLDRPRYSMDLINTRNNLFGLQVGHALNEDHELYYKGSYQDYYDNFYRNRLELQIGSGELDPDEPYRLDGENLTEASFVDARTRRYFGDTGNQRERQHHTFGGILETGIWTIDYSVYQHKWDLASEWYNWNFNDFDLDFTYSVDDPNLPTFTVDTGENLLDQSTARFSSLRIHNSATSDEDFAWRIDGESKAYFAGNDVWIQTGFLHREKERQSGEEREVYNVDPNNPFFLSEIENDSRPGRIIDGAFDHQAGLDPKKGRSFFSSDPEKFAYSDFQSRIESAPTSYNAFEEVDGLYALAITQTNDWTIEVGGRFEETHTRSRGRVVLPEAVNDPNEGILLEKIARPGSNDLLIIKDLYASNQYSNFIPAIQSHYEFGGNSGLKISWHEALMRPQYFDIVNYRRVSIPTRSISEGNPNLNPTTLDKLRIAYLFENATLGKLSAEIYRINIESFFYGAISKEQVLENGKPVEYSVGRVENGESGWIQGFEMQWIKPFDNLFAFEQGNARIAYTYSDSEATVSTRPDEALPVPERSRHLLKAGVNAEAGKWAYAIDLTYQSKALDDVGDIQGRDEYREDVVSLSLNTAYRFTEDFEFTLSLRNLSDHRERSYEGDPIRKQRNQYSSWFGIAGFQKTF